MDLLRWGAEKPREDATELVRQKTPAFSGFEEHGKVYFEVHGERGYDRPNTRYGYRIEMTPDELAALVASAIADAGDEEGGQALAVLVRAALRGKIGRTRRVRA